jgi:hypothetical protein
MTGYLHSPRPNHSLRFRDDTWQEIRDLADAENSDHTRFVNEAAEARCGFARCFRCGQPVPVEWGNLRGMSLDDAITEAVRAAAGQKCRAHETVRIGAEQAAFTSPGAVLFIEPAVKP